MVLLFFVGVTFCFCRVCEGRCLHFVASCVEPFCCVGAINLLYVVSVSSNLFCFCRFRSKIYSCQVYDDAKMTFLALAWCYYSYPSLLCLRSFCRVCVTCLRCVSPLAAPLAPSLIVSLILSQLDAFWENGSDGVRLCVCFPPPSPSGYPGRGLRVLAGGVRSRFFRDPERGAERLAPGGDPGGVFPLRRGPHSHQAVVSYNVGFLLFLFLCVFEFTFVCFMCVVSLVCVCVFSV